MIAADIRRIAASLSLVTIGKRLILFVIPVALLYFHAQRQSEKREDAEQKVKQLTAVISQMSTTLHSVEQYSATAITRAATHTNAIRTIHNAENTVLDSALPDTFVDQLRPIGKD